MDRLVRMQFKVAVEDFMVSSSEFLHLSTRIAIVTSTRMGNKFYNMNSKIKILKEMLLVC